MIEWWLEVPRKTHTRSCSGRRPTSIQTLRRVMLFWVAGTGAFSVQAKRTISLVGALCGLELEITRLDGWKLQLTKSPGEIVQSMMRGLNQFENNDAADQRARVYDIRVMARMTTSHRRHVKSNLRGSRSGHGRLSQSEGEGVRSRATMRRLGQQSQAQ